MEAHEVSRRDHFVDLVSGIMPFDVGSSRGPGVERPGR